MLAPAHFADVDQALNAGLHFNESAIVSHNDNFTLDMIADFEVGVKVVPRMGSKLLDAESDTLLLVVEVEDNDLDILVEFHHFVGI